MSIITEGDIKQRRGSSLSVISNVSQSKNPPLVNEALDYVLGVSPKPRSRSAGKPNEEAKRQISVITVGNYVNFSNNKRTGLSSFTATWGILGKGGKWQHI
jgi:hypothetical protein